MTLTELEKVSRIASALRAIESNLGLLHEESSTHLKSGVSVTQNLASSALRLLNDLIPADEASEEHVPLALASEYLPRPGEALVFDREKKMIVCFDATQTNPVVSIVHLKTAEGQPSEDHSAESRPDSPPEG